MDLHGPFLRGTLQPGTASAVPSSSTAGATAGHHCRPQSLVAQQPCHPMGSFLLYFHVSVSLCCQPKPRPCEMTAFSLLHPPKQPISVLTPPTSTADAWPVASTALWPQPTVPSAPTSDRMPQFAEVTAAGSLSIYTGGEFCLYAAISALQLDGFR